MTESLPDYHRVPPHLLCFSQGANKRQVKEMNSGWVVAIWQHLFFNLLDTGKTSSRRRRLKEHRITLIACLITESCEWEAFILLADILISTSIEKFQKLASSKILPVQMSGEEHFCQCSGSDWAKTGYYRKLLKSPLMPYCIKVASNNNKKSNKKNKVGYLVLLGHEFPELQSRTSVISSHL